MGLDAEDFIISLLAPEEIWGVNKLEPLKNFGLYTRVTDLCVLTGAKVFEGQGPIGLDGCWVYTTEICGRNVTAISPDQKVTTGNQSDNSGVIRPILNCKQDVFKKITSGAYYIGVGVKEVEFGYYPDCAVDWNLQLELENEFKWNGLTSSGRQFSKADYPPVIWKEYEYKGSQYVRVESNANTSIFTLSNGEIYSNGDYVWLKVLPIRWLVDEESQTLICKAGLISGIAVTPASSSIYSFSYSDIQYFLKIVFLPELLKNISLLGNKVVDSHPEKKEEPLPSKTKKSRNPYGFSMSNVSEEDIIRGCIESNLSVFLHGPSSEGKSARVKQIDPECEIIYLRNASPESLNGKSVYNQTTGEMIDVKPTWLIRLEEKCKKEPNKKHILFFDEITNALPSIQGIAFNIVLDKEVNGKWKLPDNARIVAAGNEMQDSLSANQLAEPLFNRFAHVYIKTTTESWLKWASENDIHPAIYSYIAYKKGEALRSKYDGKKPNADPRKWEMASKMLYSTQNPQMLRSLIGEDITREFVEFCNQRVITIEDVVSDNYTEKDIEELNTSERYATTMGLSQVDETNLEKVREFVGKIGAEFTSMFDLLWTHNDESRLEKIAELNVSDEPVKILSHSLK